MKVFELEAGFRIAEEFVYDIEKFGVSEESIPNIIGYGMHSIVFDYSNDLVFVITLEKEKYKFLKSLAEKTNLEIKKIKKAKKIEGSYSEEFLEYLFEFSSLNLDMFLMSKGEKLNLEDLELSFYNDSVDRRFCIISEALSSISEDNFEYSNIVNKEYLLHEKTKFTKGVKVNIMSNLENLKKEFSIEEEMYIDLSEKVLKSIEVSLEALETSDIRSDFVIDVHAEQFIKLGEDILCIDPAMFNYHDVI